MIDEDSDGNEFTACDSCYYRAKNLHHIPASSWGSTWARTERDLCHVCYNTFAANAAEYPEQYPDHNSMRLVAWGINYLADLIREQSTPIIQMVPDDRPCGPV